MVNVTRLAYIFAARAACVKLGNKCFSYKLVYLKD